MKRLALLSLFFVTIIWGFGFILVDVGLRELTTAQFMFYRFLIATFAVGICLNKKILTILSTEWKYGSILGSILYISFYLQTEGLKYTTATKNAFLTATYMVFVPILIYIFERKRVSNTKILCVIMAVIGSGMMVLTNDLSINVGDILTLACAVTFAMHIYLTAVYIRKCRFLILVFIQMLLISILAFFFALPQGIPTKMQPLTIAMVTLSGIFATALSYFIQTWAQHYVSETTSALIMSMESVVGMIASVIILGEVLTTRMILGAIIILISVICSEIRIKLPSIKKLQ